MNKECVIQLHSEILPKYLQNYIMKFSDKLIELGKNHLEQGNPDIERQTRYVLTYKWIFVV